MQLHLRTSEWCLRLENVWYSASPRVTNWCRLHWLLRGTTTASATSTKSISTQCPTRTSGELMVISVSLYVTPTEWLHMAACSVAQYRHYEIDTVHSLAEWGVSVFTLLYLFGCIQVISGDPLKNVLPHVRQMQCHLAALYRQRFWT